MRHLIITCLCLFLFAAGAHGRTLTLNVSDAYPYSSPDNRGLADQIILDAFRRIGVDVRLIHSTPSERALQNLNDGVVDGEFLRISGLEKLYPNLVMVPEDILTFDFIAFSRNRKLRISGWESLKPLNVAYITGWKILENNVPETRSLTKVRDADALFALLPLNRADLVIFERVAGKSHLQRKGITGIHGIDPPLVSRKMYLYLHRDHAPLLPKLAEAIRDIKREGKVRDLTRAIIGSED